MYKWWQNVTSVPPQLQPLPPPPLPTPATAVSSAVCLVSVGVPEKIEG